MNKLLYLPILIALTTGCVQKKTIPDNQYDDVGTIVLDNNLQPVTADTYQSPTVVRYDRYRLINTSPSVAQKRPIEQLIDIKLPSSLAPTVGDVIHYTLRQSGYTLCTDDDAVKQLLINKPLPAVHYQLGPMILKDALQILAGQAWQLEIDDVQREVCYSLRKEYQMPVLKSAKSERQVP